MAIIMYSVPQQHGIGEKHIYFLKRQKQLHLSDAQMKPFPQNTYTNILGWDATDDNGINNGNYKNNSTIKFEPTDWLYNSNLSTTFEY